MSGWQRAALCAALLAAPVAPVLPAPALPPPNQPALAAWLRSAPGHPVVRQVEELCCQEPEQRGDLAAELRRRGDQRALLAMMLATFPELKQEGEADLGELLDEAIEGARQADPELWGRLSIERAYLAFYSGDVAAGLVILRPVVERTAEGGSLSVALAVAEIYQRAQSGLELGEVRARLDDIEASVRRHGSYRDRLVFLSTSAQNHHELGNAAEAVAAYELQERLARAFCRPGAEAAAVIEGTAARIDLEAPTDELRRSVRQNAEKGLRLAERGGSPVHAAMAHELLADFGAPEAAEAHLKSCIDSAGAGAPDLAAICRLALAARWAESDPAAAARQAARAFATAEDGEPRVWPYLWSHHLRALWRLEPDTARALAESLAFFELFETFFDYQPFARQEVAAVWTEANDWLVGRLLEDGPTDDSVAAAFQVGERMRARSLTEPRLAGSAAPLPDAAEERLRELGTLHLRRLRRLWERRAPGGPGDSAAGDSAALDRREAELRGELDRMALPGTSFRPRRLVTLDEVQQELEPGEAMLVYHLGSDVDTAGRFAGGAWLLTIRAGGLRVQRLEPDRWQLDGASLHAFLRLEDPLASPDLRAYLYDLLLRPALDDESAPPVSRLIVVPDRALFMLPFAALGPRAEISVGEPSGGLAGVAVQVVPSATLWLELRRSPPPAGAEAALVIADPVLSTERRTAMSLPPLPRVRKQAPCLRRSLGPGAVLWLGRAASEERLAEADLGRFGSLWFLAHASADQAAYPGKGARSAVYLAGAGIRDAAIAGSSDGGSYDGDLEPEEIQRLPLAGKLVVLAACESGVGRNLRGEGPLSLARAFFQAGARTVIATYWQVEDGATACLVGELAHELRGGAAVDEALAAVQGRRRSAGLSAHDWAATAVLGDGSWRPYAEPARRSSDVCCPAGGSHAWPWAVTVAFCAALALLLWWFRGVVLWRASGARVQCPPS